MKKLLMMLLLLTMSLNTFAITSPDPEDEIGSIKKVRLINPSAQCIEIAEYHGSQVVDPDDCPYVMDPNDCPNIWDDPNNDQDLHLNVNKVIFNINEANLEALKVDLHYQECEFQVLQGENVCSDRREGTALTDNIK